jgi:hypothetical protein
LSFNNARQEAVTAYLSKRRKWTNFPAAERPSHHRLIEKDQWSWQRKLQILYGLLALFFIDVLS